MNYKSIFIIILTIIIFATLFISIKKPKMHKVALIYDSDYSIVNNETTKEENTFIPTVVQEEQTKSAPTRLYENIEKETSKKPLQVKNESVNKISQPKKVEVKPNKVVTPIQTVQKTVSQQPKKAETTVNKVVAPVQTVQKTVSQPPKTTETKVNKAPSTVKTVEKTPTTTVLTKEQEEILWNVWRSNIQNQIMKDTHLPTVPNGTVFRFSFVVDKFGKISDIQTYSDTKAYIPYAIQYIAPVIRSYQGKNILNFPTGTKRTVTTVKGAWKISNSTRYSTPNDYNDTEVIQR